MKTQRKTILAVDDDPGILKALQIRLKYSGFDVLTAPDGAAALHVAQMMRPDLIITDIWMPVGVGFSLAYLLRQSLPAIPVIFITASKDSRIKKMADQVGAAAFLEKPYEAEALLAAINRALETRVPATHRNDDSTDSDGTVV